MLIASSRRRWTDLSPRTVHLFLAVSLLLIVGVVSALGRITWTTDTQRASATADTLSAMIEQDIRRTIALYDLSIQATRDAVQDPTVMQAPQELRDRILFDRATASAYIGALMVLDPSGNVVAASRPVPPAARNGSDRDYFRIHMLEPAFGLYVSRPLASRIDGQQVVALSRRITRPDGGFGGIVVGTLRVEYLRQLFQHLPIGPHGSMTLFRNDGTVMMREPFDPALVGMRRASQVMFDHASRSPDGEYFGISPIDGEPRLHHFRRVGALPLIADAGLSTRDVHADWWGRMAFLGGIVALCCGAIAFVTLRLGHELRRRIEAEAALVALADTDGLTGLANRRCFDRVLETEWRRSAETRRPLSLLMIDTDHFKGYNDLFGHTAGDEVLREIGRSLMALARRSGHVAARYGGEEFAMVLPDLDRAGALRLADTLRRAVEHLGIPHPHSPLDVLTVSVGCATAEHDAMASAADLAAAADAALYHSKRAGRNAVREHRSEVVPLPLAS